MSRFSLLYEAFVTRETIDGLREQQRAQINAIVANSAYVESSEGIQARKDAIEEINEQYDDVITSILHPELEVEVDPSMQAVLDAGMRGMERIKWDIAAGIDPRQIMSGGR